MAEPDTFRVRLNCIDHYQSPPSALDPPLWGSSTYSSTQRGRLPNVPVIRIFGATETGQKVCMHIHGAFPYLYVPYMESLEQDVIKGHIRDMKLSIDHALALSFRRNPYAEPKSAQFVAHISLVKGVPFFGYHVGYKYYLKIYLLNPTHMTRLSDLLQQGAILQRHFQPYEAHLQYLLQWMCDFNLYGCTYVETKKPYFRLPVPSAEELDDLGGLSHLWHDVSIDPSQILDEQHFQRQSHCQLELDIKVEEILNRHDQQPRELHQSFVERLACLENLPPEEKLVQSMAGLWKDETKRRKRRMGLSDPSSSPFPPEVLVSMSADPRNSSEGGWIHEAEFREMVDELAKQEKKARGGEAATFESFLTQKSTDDGVQTVFESIEELFNDKLSSLLRLNMDADDEEQLEADGPKFTGWGDLPATPAPQQTLVDESSIARVADDDDYGSDEEVVKHHILTQQQKLKDAGVDYGLGEAEVNGNLLGIEAQAEQLEGAVVPTGTVRAAESGLLKRSALTASQGPFKRVKFDHEQEAAHPNRAPFRVNDVKRPKPEKAYSVPSNRLQPPSGAQLAVRSEVDSLAAISSGQPPSSQPQRSSQAQSLQTSSLGFPIVKNANDPDTTLRLSQRDDLSHIPQRGSQNTVKTASTSFEITYSTTTDKTPTRSALKPSIDGAAIANYATAFSAPSDPKIFIFGSPAPSCEEIEQTIEPSVIYQDAYYSNEKDVPERPREYAGQEFRLESTTLPFLPEFDKLGKQLVPKGAAIDKVKQALAEQRRRQQCTLRRWEIMKPPPTFDDVRRWLDTDGNDEVTDLDQLEIDGPPAASQIKRKNRPAPELSQIDGPTQKNKHGFKVSQRKKSTSVQHETGYMSTMALEAHVNSRGDFAPDPEKDEVNMVVWCIADEQLDEDLKMGIVLLCKEGDDLPDRIQRIVGNGITVDAEETEIDLINRMVDIVREHDPDILTGFEVHNSSWGYLIERARLIHEFNLPDEFSRMKSQSHGRFGKDADRWGFTHTSTVRITGRHTINIWRAMRSELNLLQYTMENVVFHLLHRRIPHYTFATLTKWYSSDKPRDLKKLVDYFVSRTKLDMEILDANELIPRTSEQARLLGVDFFSVFSRGSQFKVESLMFRIAKPESFVLVSPSRKQVGAQNALECLPLVMEPQSAFYSSPLLVLDFQSLYPSVMIAYNYCYSTCLGRIVNWRGTNKLGFADFKRTPGLLELVQDKLNIAPNGMMYVQPEMRKSLLAKMLGEILETRVMVKSGMKVDKDDKTLQQLLNNRQLALKLIANVTYGYTSASFSGRMPCSEIADSIVQTGRETLEKAIAFIHSVERWGAEVVYGDTDSLFVYLRGRTRDDAFKIGAEISKAITNMNPRPIKLKFEKVYHPCVLLAKKRYVGFKYESPNQTEPDFDAKGIETIRRDGTPAEQKIEEKALKLLFRTSDLSEIKKYFQQQCTKIMTGRFSVQDFCFAKEVKLGTYSDKGVAPPGALIATKRMLKDPRTEPQYGERVPYVVIAGGPGARLWERCVEPERLIYDENAELDAEYYINKNLIPPLERIFNLVGANVRQWYDEMPKVQRIRLIAGVKDGETNGKSRKTMESYMGSSLCIVCRTKLPSVPPGSEAPQLPLCDVCRTVKAQETLLALRQKLQKAKSRADDLERSGKGEYAVEGGQGWGGEGAGSA
ncbi:DNA polymerase zeta [Extremus antarcticus]|uniref:DNA polymerase n=1 Tax=Extremus antarcticus TaxID=702011 RepID=A0AAJ0DLK2_9PEZI|nr:DNA polymerase zeta [Extremus antarcticus]